MGYLDNPPEELSSIHLFIQPIFIKCRLCPWPFSELWGNDNEYNTQIPIFMELTFLLGVGEVGKCEDRKKKRSIYSMLDGEDAIMK